MWLWCATLTIHISFDPIVVGRFGWVVWSASQVREHFGVEGDLKMHIALILESRNDRKPVEILRTIFGADQVSRMAHMLGLKGRVPGGIF